MSRANLVTALAAAAALAGCGDARTRPPDLVAPARVPGYARVSLPSAGIRLRRSPSSWRVAAGQPPLVATISSGDGEVAIWRYQRVQPLPATPVATRAALAALLAAVRARDPAIRVLRTKVSSVDGHPALVLIADETIDGSPRETRSTHVFAYGAEVVFDAYAPVADFAAADRAVFLPMVHSAALRRP